MALRRQGFPSTGWQALYEAQQPGLFQGPESVLVDIQQSQVLFRLTEIQPVPDSMTSFGDFEKIFGKEPLQCAFKALHEHFKWVKIIGHPSELQEWDSPMWDDQGVGAPNPPPSHLAQNEDQANQQAAQAAQGGGNNTIYAGVTFEGTLYSRRYDQYGADAAAQAGEQRPPPPHPHEMWVVRILNPVLESLYPPADDSRRLKYDLYLPKNELEEDAEVTII